MSETGIVNRKRRCSGDSDDDSAMKRTATVETVVTVLDSTLSATDWSFCSQVPVSPKQLLPEDVIESTKAISELPESTVEVVPVSPKQLLPETNSAGEDVTESAGTEAISELPELTEEEVPISPKRLLPDTNSAEKDAIRSSGTEAISELPESIVEENITGGKKLSSECFDPAIDVGPSEPHSLFQLSFHDVNTCREIKPVLVQAIRAAMLQLKRTITITSDNLQLTVTEAGEPGATEECCFIVDELGSMPTVESQTGEAIAVVPKYRLNVHKVFNNDQPEPLNEEATKRPARNSCWNCDGEHSMRDCTEPRNFNKVRQNRAKFSSGKTERYHVDATQRFGTFVPGEISNELRKALGLHRNELPLHIYRMRELGYPPGWLENAKVSQSGLALFDENGSARSAKKTSDEMPDDEFRYDLRKIVSFPGFNVPKADVKENKFFRPMLAFQSKDAMLRTLQHNSVQSHRVKKLKNIPVDALIPDNANLLELTSAEMDIDDVDEGELTELNMPPLPAEKPFNPTPPPLPPTEENTAGSVSPSLDDLREQQERLLAALNESTSTVINATLGDDSLIDDILALDDTQNTCATSTVETDLDTSNQSNDSIMNVTGPLPETPKSILTTNESQNDTITASLNGSKKLVFGTPLIESVSPFTVLPSGSSWSVGVSDIMDFENLPESIGKYKQMKGVINKVRDAVKQLNDEYD